MHGSDGDREIETLDQLPQTSPQSAFIGRQAELEDLLDQLSRHRWLTIVGVGGCGKTSLALHVARRAQDRFEHGACWVALDAVNDRALVPQAVAAALGVEAKPPLSFEDAILGRLANQNILLVLDNCEHMLEASRALCDAIYEYCPRVTLLTTSRTALGSPNEVRWDAPLLIASDAIALFLDRARTHITPNGSSESHALIAEICRRVDCLPLAIELAAARTKVLSLAQIRDRLAQTLGVQLPAQAPSADRHATMRAALDWSFDLLTPHERQLFLRLSVFAGGFTLEAAEEVCADEVLSAEQVLPLLSELIDHSLVVISERSVASVRYRLLEPVREFAAQRLGESTAFNVVHRRHVECCHRLVQQAAQHWHTREQTDWLNRLQAEHGNLRTALRWCLDSHQHLELGFQIAIYASLFWETRGHYEEGERWLRELLDNATADITPEIEVEARAEATYILSRLLSRQGKFDGALQISEQVMSLAQLAEADPLIVRSLNGLAGVHYELGNFDTALRLIQDAELIVQGLSDSALLADVLNNHALVLQRVGDLREAQRLFEEVLAHSRASGDVYKLGLTLHNLAMVLDSRGDYSRARQCCEEALIVWREFGDRHWEANTLGLLAGVLVSSDRPSEAEMHARACLRLYEQLGIRADQVYPLADLALISLVRGDMRECQDHLQRMHAFAQESGDKTQIARSINLLALASAEESDWMAARTYCVQALMMRRDGGSRYGIATCLETAARICAHTNQLAEAAQFLGAATAMRETIDRRREPFEERLVAQTIETIRNRIGKGAFDDASQRGARQAQTFQDAAQFALQTLQRQDSEPTPDLRFSALGDVEVFAQGRQLVASDWTYAKSRELVFYLLLHPGATREEVGLDFWPEASTEQVRKRFSAALSHARNALGREHQSIVLLDGRYWINPELHVWFDVQAFEQALDSAQRCLGQDGAEQQAIRYLETATRLYRGDLLKDVDAEWLIAPRESLRQRHLDALLKLGELYLRSSMARLPDAVTVLQRAVALDPYSEAAHVSLVRTYLKLGERDRARQQYQILIAALKDLGVPPSADATTLAKQMR